MYKVRLRTVSRAAYLEKATKEFLADARRLRLRARGPVPLPRKTHRFAFNRSVFKYNRSKEVFQIQRRDRLIYLEAGTPAEAARADGLCRYWLDNTPVESVGIAVQRELPLAFRQQRVLNIGGALVQMIPAPKKVSEQERDTHDVYNLDDGAVTLSSAAWFNRSGPVGEARRERKAAAAAARQQAAAEGGGDDA